MTIHNSEIVCVDFDETLFNHHAFDEWVDGRLAESGYIEPGQYLTTTDNYHTRLSSVLRFYDHNKHVKDLTGREWSFISGYLKSQVRESTCLFCYGDAHTFIRNIVTKVDDVRILSFGHGEFQRYKIGYCSVLRELDLPTHIVDRPKSEFLADHFGHIGSGILVDDKYPLSLPQNFKHVLIDRKKRYPESRLDPSIFYTITLSEPTF